MDVEKFRCQMVANTYPVFVVLVRSGAYPGKIKYYMLYKFYKSTQYRDLFKKYKTNPIVCEIHDESVWDQLYQSKAFPQFSETVTERALRQKYNEELSKNQQRVVIDLTDECDSPVKKRQVCDDEREAADILTDMSIICKKNKTK